MNHNESMLAFPFKVEKAANEREKVPEWHLEMSSREERADKAYNRTIKPEADKRF